MNFGEILKSVEDAVFEIMVWILLLPKTLFRVMLKPKWAMEYITEEWDKEERFDEYLSPVLLWLLSAVIPITAVVVLVNSDVKTTADFFNEVSNRVFPVTLYMTLVPFVYIAWMEWLNKEPIKRSALKISFYRHCYLLAPAQILTLISIALWGIPPLIIVTVLIVPAYEAFAFQSELKVGYWRAFLYTCVPQIIVVFLAFIAIGALSAPPS